MSFTSVHLTQIRMVLISCGFCMDGWNTADTFKNLFCAILYVFKSRRQWRMLPRDFPKWQVVYSYFLRWNQKPSDSELSQPELALENMVGEVRIDSDRSEKTTFVIVAAQSMKNTYTAEQKGYDAGKKVSGIKRHIAVDTQGLPHAIADVTGRAGTSVAVSNHRDSLSAVTNVLVNGDCYTGQPAHLLQ